MPVTADGTDTLDVFKAKVGKAIRLHPDTFILKHRGIVLGWIQHVRAYELPDCPLLEAEVGCVPVQTFPNHGFRAETLVACKRIIEIRRF